jgi:hypothetical protein
MRCSKTGLSPATRSRMAAELYMISPRRYDGLPELTYPFQA